MMVFLINGQSKTEVDTVHKELSNFTVPGIQDFVRPQDSGLLAVAFINDNGDTILVSSLNNVDISSPRRFSTHQDFKKYIRYKYCAAKVYPLAKEAIRIFTEAQTVSNTLKKRKKKKYLKKLSKELERKFEDPLKKLSKTEGKILVKMIERELETSLYDLIKMTRGKFKAFYWNQSSKLYGYRLKEKYEEGQNSILDLVLQDFDISYDLAEKSTH